MVIVKHRRNKSDPYYLLFVTLTAHSSLHTFKLKMAAVRCHCREIRYFSTSQRLDDALNISSAVSCDLRRGLVTGVVLFSAHVVSGLFKF